MKNKREKISEIHGYYEAAIYKSSQSLHSVCDALYISAKGTKHFYEVLDLLSDILPDVYKEEFEALNQ